MISSQAYMGTSSRLDRPSTDFNLHFTRGDPYVLNPSPRIPPIVNSSETENPPRIGTGPPLSANGHPSALRAGEQSPKSSVWSKFVPSFGKDQEAFGDARKELEVIIRMVKDEADSLKIRGVNGKPFDKLYEDTRPFGLELRNARKYVEALVRTSRWTLEDRDKLYKSWRGMDEEYSKLQQSSKTNQRRLKERYEDEVNKLKTDNWLLGEKVKELEDSIRLLDGEKRSLEQEFEEEKRRMEGHHYTQWKAREREHLSVLTTKERDFQQELETLNSRHKQQEAKMQADHRAVQEGMAKKFKERERKLQSDRQAEAENFISEIESLKTTLRRRDRFPRIPDKKLQLRVEDLADQVKSLARLEWTQTSDWTTNLLNKCSSPRSQRALKRQILQDTIWVILQCYIFNSPFRVFGEEGRSMEKEYKEWANRFCDG
jgi:hypothetical protein